MNASRSDWCGYEWPADCERVDIHTDDPTHQSCCIRKPVDDAERCVWHVDPAETDEKTIDALADARVPDEIAAQTWPVGELLDGAVLRGLTLENSIVFGDTALRGTDLSGADLEGAALTDADLQDATLTEAVLVGADLTDADLTRSTARWANMSESTAPNADFTDSDLLGVDFESTVLRDSMLDGAVLNWRTVVRCQTPRGVDQRSNCL